jgi:hypothetical protein
MCAYPIRMGEESGGDVPGNANLPIGVAPTLNQGFGDLIEITHFLTALYPR